MGFREPNQNVQEISRIGRALYSLPEESYHYSSETLSTVKLLELDEETSLERAASALVFQALKKSKVDQSIASTITPFYQLDPYDRFILSALHLCHWTYEKCARILNIPESQVSKRAWSARTRFMEKLIHSGKEIRYPIQAEIATSQCPEFNLQHPWSQKILDDEIHGKERIFLQNHIMACDACRSTLNQTRELFFVIDEETKKILAHSSENDLNLEIKLQKHWENLNKNSELKRLFRLSLIDFLKTPPMKLLIAAFIFFVFLWLFS